MSVNATTTNTALEDAKKKLRLRLCIMANAGLFVLMVLAMLLFYDKHSTYLRYGPHDDLNVVGIRINSWGHYISLQFFMAILEVVDVVVNEVASPILGFNIYNPDKKVITGFTRAELQFYANSMWILNAMKNVVMVVVSISQIDIALLRAVYGQVASFYTIRILLLEKSFPDEDNAPYAPVQADEESAIELAADNSV